MHTLIDRAVDTYLRSTYGEGLAALPLAPGSGARDSDVLARGQARLHAAAALLGKPEAEMLEDLGAWLTLIESVRRLLRFSGRDFHDFLLALEDLPGRAELVLPALRIPPLRVTPEESGLSIVLQRPDLRWQHVLTGLVRGMADDYGSLCLIACLEGRVRVDIWEERFAEGRAFTLHPGDPVRKVRAG